MKAWARALVVSHFRTRSKSTPGISQLSEVLGLSIAMSSEHMRSFNGLEQYEQVTTVLVKAGRP